ncbi:biotin transporter BioY [Heliobacterium undosum]|uniref:Biotin transporter n=1 Tax=Heliomicrobium undosum TaxID=121734 RepID=A0A845KXK4_9FIRM|nr:biotin transporter BioY [Heliomicrobium undosum]MZP28332.1 biotin transporter BioY [Heliomicrobium undosum]
MVGWTPREMAQVALFAALTAAGAFIKVPVPFVPFTLQYLFVAMAGIALGSRLGLASQLVYIGIGLIGLPVFAEGGGPGYVLKPTFGYLIGFALGAWLIGRLTERLEKASILPLFGATMAGLAVIYGIGALYLYGIMNMVLAKSITLWNTLLYGILLPLPGDILLSGAAAYIGVKLWSLRGVSGNASTGKALFAKEGVEEEQRA